MCLKLNKKDVQVQGLAILITVDLGYKITFLASKLLFFCALESNISHLFQKYCP